MCEEEKYTLQLLVTETVNQSQIFKDKQSPYLISLENGIKKAEERLKDCEYNRCMSQFYDMNVNYKEIKKMNIKVTKEKIDQFKKCLSLM